MSENRDDDGEFDAFARRALRELPVPELAPIRAPRRGFLRMGLKTTLGLAALGGAGWVATTYASTPRVVQLASAHGTEEEALHGMLAANLPALQEALGLSGDQALPGIVQLCKDCVIGTHAAWHFNTFMDGLGGVQVFVFREPVPDARGEGWWLGEYWRFLDGARHPTLLLSQRPNALAALASRLAHP